MRSFHSKEIKRLRIDKGYTQEKLAQLCEVGREYICAIENGKYDSKPSFEFVDNLAAYLGVTVYDIMDSYSDGYYRITLDEQRKEAWGAAWEAASEYYYLEYCCEE